MGRCRSKMAQMQGPEPRFGGRYLGVIASIILLIELDTLPAARAGSPPSWMAPFITRNNVTVDSGSGVSTLQGFTTNAYLAPSAGLLSVDAYDGDIQINVTISGYNIVQSGYQACISLFMAPTNYTLGDYTSWPDTGALASKQHAWLRAKIYQPSIPAYTFVEFWSAALGNSSSGGAGGGWISDKGVLSLRRRGDLVSSFIQISGQQPVNLPGPFKVATGPVLLGLQVLYGFNFSVSVSSISVGYGSIIRPSNPPPPPSPSPAPPSPPAPPPQYTSDYGGAWMTFRTRNNVTYNPTTRTATLEAFTTYSSSLAPSAGLITVDAYDGDLTINATISSYKLVQSGYQASISLFMAPTNYTLGDYTSWPDTGALASKQHAWLRAKVYPDYAAYTFGAMYSAAQQNNSDTGLGGGWLSDKGVLSLRRRGDLVSSFIQISGQQPVNLPGPFKVATGPVLLGLQVLYGFNFSVSISDITISYGSIVKQYSSPPPPPPSPPPPGPPSPPAPTAPPPQYIADYGGAWMTPFVTRNNVTYDPVTRSATLQGFTSSGSGSLAPSAGLLTIDTYNGDFAINVTVSGYKLVQSGYQALISLFMAPASYGLADYLSWPESGVLAEKQYAWVRAKIHPDSPAYTFGSMYSAAQQNGSEVGVGGGWLSDKGVLSLRRRGDLVSSFIQISGQQPVNLPGPFKVATGPVLLGLQVLYGFNFSVSISDITISYGSTAPRPPSPPPPPPPSPSPPPPPLCQITQAEEHVYPGGFVPKGAGGGGAMSSFSISPYNDLWFVGTDMGSLYRSTNRGATWTPIDLKQIRQTNDMGYASPVGFSADGTTLFFAPCYDPSRGMPCVAKRSLDGGLTWTAMDVNAEGMTVFKRADMPPNNKRPIKYWSCSTKDANLCYAATSGGLDRTADKGSTWRLVNHTLLAGLDSLGTFMDSSSEPVMVYHATPSGVYKWPEGQPENVTTVLSGPMHWFAGGRDASGLTLVYVDRDADFCLQAWGDKPWGSEDLKTSTLSTCGRMWVSVDGGATFTPTQHYTYKVLMAENNGRKVYSHPHRGWARNYGVRIFLSNVTPDGQVATTKVFDQVDLDNQYSLWPASKLEYSAVGLDQGYWDGGYYYVHVNQLNADEAGGSENFFLHVTRDGGQHWESPFTRFRDCGVRTAGKRWSSTGLEPISVYTLSVHPTAPHIIYAGAADIKGMVSEDGGESWRILDPSRQAAGNSIYSFAFDPSQPSRVLVAGAKWHDWPNGWYASPLAGNGGIFVSEDIGRTYTRVGSPSSTSCDSCSDMINDFLAVAYDHSGGYLYAGCHIDGIARIRYNATNGMAYSNSRWEWINEGLVGDDLWQNETVVPRIQIDPENGDVYCLLTGNRVGGTRNYMNQPRTGVYWMPRGGTIWKLLRGQINMAPGITGKPWYYPTAFAVDWTKGTPGKRTHLLLADYQNNYQAARTCGIWKTTDGGATWNYKQQLEWSNSLTIDPKNPNRVYASGSRAFDAWGIAEPGGWGYGGLMWSDDGGETWTPYDAFPFQASGASVTVDPGTSCKAYYTTWGGGVVYGPAPPGLPGC